MKRFVNEFEKLAKSDNTKFSEFLIPFFIASGVLDDNKEDDIEDIFKACCISYMQRYSKLWFKEFSESKQNEFYEALDPDFKGYWIELMEKERYGVR